MPLDALDIVYVPLKDLKPNPLNRKKHPPEQISLLKDLISYQGFRVPLVVSNQTGHIVSGNGRYLAAKSLKLKEVPVIYQDFTPDQEIAHGIADNASGLWGFLDFAGINEDISRFDGETFDLGMLGLKDFDLDPPVKEESEEETKTKSIKFIECPNCQTEFEIKQGKNRNA